MWIKVTLSDAANILLACGKVNDGFYQWGGTLQLRHPEHWRKARKRRELRRKLKNHWGVGDGWWVYRRD